MRFTVFFFLMTFWVGTSIGQIKPLKGTWINLAYQDVRNKYTNPAHVDYTSPEFWSTKIVEYADMGIEYLIIMAVANEERAYYPSNFMPLAYPKERLSPIEAIMNTADSLGLKVFMSCGWAINQYDNHHMPEVPVLHRKIMDETAKKFGKHKSFYGWYLPIEDGLFPYLSDQAIDVANSLTAYGKKLVAHSKVLISPYGLWMAEIGTDKFAEQIRKLKVDIVAYQDEVGCVREPLPIHRVKENFETLGRIHQGTDITFWANVESFTWEKGTNSIESALIPSAFPRLLSQMAGATLSGASELVTFATQGMFDKPDSNMPIGQPLGAAQAYQDYADWKSKKGRWPWLEFTFLNRNLDHIAKGKGIMENVKSVVISRTNLNDGVLGVENPKDSNWSSFNEGRMNITMDLKKKQQVSTIIARFLHYRNDNISIPQVVTFSTSSDGKTFKKIRSISMDSSHNDKHDCWIDIALLDDLFVDARFIKIEAETNGGQKILCDEILVNPKLP